METSSKTDLAGRCSCLTVPTMSTWPNLHGRGVRLYMSLLLHNPGNEGGVNYREAAPEMFIIRGEGIRAPTPALNKRFGEIASGTFSPAWDPAP